MKIKFFPESLKSNIENYLLVQISFYASILCFTGLIINVFHRTETNLFLTTLIPAVIFLIIYFLGRFNENLHVSKQLLVIGLLVVANVEWMVTYGSKGNMIMLFLIIELLIFVFTESWKRYVYFFITVLNVLTLLYLEYLDSNLVPYTTNDTTLKIDLGISFILFSIALYLIIQLALNEYISQKTRWKNIFQAVGQPAFVLTSDQILIEMNEAAVKASGKKKSELIGMHCYQLFHDSNATEPPKECPLIKMVESGKIESKEMKLKFLNGTFMVTCTPVFIKGKLDHVIHIATDISEQKRTEKELVLAKEKAEENDLLKSAFLANMSHEIRTPMNGILGFADLLKDPQLSANKQSEYVNIIEKSGHRMLNLINDLIDISKIEAGQMDVKITSINLKNQLLYLHTFFNPEASKKGLQFISGKNSELDIEIKTDKEKFLAILINLLKNAIKYTNNGSIEFGYTIQNNYIEFFIKDTGIGIHDEKHKSIFERFVQADLNINRPYEGAGLGLAITKAYVNMLGGKIWVNSELGKGTIFYFTVPYVKTKTDNFDDSDLVVEIEKIPEKISILLVDDDATSLIYLSEILKDFKNEITTAKSGDEAIKICKRNKNIDLILMDIKMPILDGYAATKKIRKFNSDVKIIAQTAYALPGDKEKALAAGCNEYISKPVQKKELLEKINICFR